MRCPSREKSSAGVPPLGGKSRLIPGLQRTNTLHHNGDIMSHIRLIKLRGGTHV